MVKVHVWNFRGSSEAWGHASMHVGAVYISWWPEGEDRDYKKGDKKSGFKPVYSVEHIHDRTFEADVADEEQKPDHDFEITGLDEQRILAWWKKFNVPGRDWTTLGQNCSTTVGRALMIGGGDDYADWSASWNTVWTPNDVKSYATSIRTGIGKAGHRVFAINFIRRFRGSPLGITSWTSSMEEEKLAKALLAEHGTNTMRVKEVFDELVLKHSADSDDVAEVYVKQLKATPASPAARAMARDTKLKALLIKVLDEGWTSADEKACIDFLKALK